MNERQTRMETQIFQVLGSSRLDHNSGVGERGLPLLCGMQGPANPWSTSFPRRAGGRHLRSSREGLGRTGVRGPSNGATRPRLTFKNSECVCLGSLGVLALVCVSVCCLSVDRPRCRYWFSVNSCPSGRPAGSIPAPLVSPSVFGRTWRVEHRTGSVGER